MSVKSQELLSLLASAEDLARELNDELSTDGVLRASVSKRPKAVLDVAQTPIELYWDVTMSSMTLPLIRTALEAGWLDTIAKASSVGVTAEELVKGKGHDAILAARIMRPLAVLQLVDEVDVKTWAPNAATKLFTAFGLRDGIIHWEEAHARVAVLFPHYFRNFNYQEPKENINGPFVYARGQTWWDFAKSVPVYGTAFDNLMRAGSMHRKSWLSVLPASKLQEFAVDCPDKVLLVDVAGGVGGNLLAFDAARRKLNISGKLILEEQAEVVAKVDAKEQFELVVHDFFKPQPESCRGARIFFLQMIMHDWCDDPCRKILGHLRDAMEPGYSKLLISDLVLPEKDCPFFEANYDIAMFVIAGKERTKSEWEELISSVAGLRIEKIWPLDEGVNFESLIEITRTA